MRLISITSKREKQNILTDSFSAISWSIWRREMKDIHITLSDQFYSVHLCKYSLWCLGQFVTDAYENQRIIVLNHLQIQDHRICITSNMSTAEFRLSESDESVKTMESCQLDLQCLFLVIPTRFLALRMMSLKIGEQKHELLSSFKEHSYWQTPSSWMERNEKLKCTSNVFDDVLNTEGRQIACSKPLI